MIYLLGTNHNIQTEWDDPGPFLSARFERFKSYLRDVIHTNMILALVEETNSEIELSKGKKSIARIIAEGTHPPLHYVPCEPNSEERRTLGIPTDKEIMDRCPPECSGDSLKEYRDTELLKYFPIREKFWIERLRQVIVSPILFVCGADHIRTFSRRLTENGIPCKILSLDWWASDEIEHGEIPLGERPI